MEVELRVVLLGVGIIILLIVGIDFYRRKPIKEAAAAGSNPERYSNARTAVVHLDDEYNEPQLDLYQMNTVNDESVQEIINLDEEQLNFFADVAEEAQMPAESLQKPIPQNIITISIMSRDRYGFNGETLLQALLNANLQFGKNNIFHRYADQDANQGEILFSVANVIEPGFFYIETLPQEHVPGIILILLPENLSNPQTALDKFIRTAKQVAFALNGEMLDNERLPMTLATLEKYQKLIQRI